MGDRLVDDEQKRFVGRSDVLQSVDAFLSSSEMIMSVVGIGGIGKSSLLRQAVTRARGAGWISLTTDMNLTSAVLDWLENAGAQWTTAVGTPRRFDGTRSEFRRVSDAVRSTFANEEQRRGSPLSREAQSELLHAVLAPADADLYVNGRRELSRALAEDLSEPNDIRVLITIDTFEKATQAFEDWLRTEFLPELDDSVRLIIGGQRRLEDGWEPWKRFTRTIELANFTETDLRELIATCAPRAGLDEKRLMTFTGGYPLAASLIVNTSQGGDFDINSLDVREQSIGRIFRSIPNPQLQDLVEAGAGFPLVTLDVLSAATGERIPLTLWRALRDLAFVSRGDQGVQIHDVVQRYLIRSALDHSPAEFSRRHLAASEYWRTHGSVSLYIHHLCVAKAAEAVRVIRALTRSAHARGDPSQADAIVSQLEASSPLFPRHATVARLTNAYIATLDGDWDGAAKSLEGGDLIDGDDGAGSLALRLEVDLFRCEISRYMGDLVAATAVAEAGLDALRAASHVSDAESQALVTAELRAQLVELYGLRGLMPQAERAAADLARSEVQGQLADEFVGQLQLFHREHLARWQGIWQEALDSLLHVADLDVSSDRYGSSRLLYGVGRVFTYIGWFTAARRLLKRAEAGFGDSHRSQQLGEALVGLSIIARETQDFTDSARYLDEAMDLFSAGGSSLYGCWVQANQYRSLAVADPAAIDLAALEQFAARCAQIEYRHGQGHSLFALDVITGGTGASAAFSSWGMRYEALEAQVSYRLSSGRTADDLALKAVSAGDLWTAARARGAHGDWIEYETAAGPQTESFEPAGISAFLPGDKADAAVSLCETSGRIYGRLRRFID